MSEFNFSNKNGRHSSESSSSAQTVWVSGPCGKQWDLAQGAASPGERAGAGQPPAPGAAGRPGEGWPRTQQTGKSVFRRSRRSPRAAISGRREPGWLGRGHGMRGHWCLQPPPRQAHPVLGPLAQSRAQTAEGALWFPLPGGPWASSAFRAEPPPHPTAPRTVSREGRGSGERSR